MTLENFYLYCRRNRYINLFVVNLKYLIGFGFLPSGIKKIVDTPFAVLGNDGVFFDYLDALYHTGFYYNFIGWAQVIAAILLITQRYATLGAFIFFPIILNIAIFTLSTIGSLTPIIATLMFFGILFLLLWDYFKWINIFLPDTEFIVPVKPNNFPGYSRIWIMAGVLILILGILFSIIIENHHLLPPNAAAKYIAGLIITTCCIPIVTFLIDEYRFRKMKKRFTS